MPVSQKKILRLIMKERRQFLSEQQSDASKKIVTSFFEFFELPPQTIVGGYWPIGSELDVRFLLHKLMEKNFKCALPSLTPQGLAFRVWTPSTLLIKGPFHILEPSPRPLPLSQLFF